MHIARLCSSKEFLVEDSDFRAQAEGLSSLGFGGKVRFRYSLSTARIGLRFWQNGIPTYGLPVRRQEGGN